MRSRFKWDREHRRPFIRLLVAAETTATAAAAAAAVIFVTSFRRRFSFEYNIEIYSHKNIKFSVCPTVENDIIFSARYLLQ